MTTRFTAAALALMLAPLFVPGALGRAAAGERFFCKCTKFCMPKNPRVRYKCICPKRFCPDSPIENFAYYPACWQQWPFPLNYCHCPVPPIVLNAPNSTLDTPPAPDKSRELPPPKPLDSETKPDDKTTTEPTLP